MSPREIVEATFRFEQTDTIPYSISIGTEVSRRLDEHYGSPAWRDRIVSYIDGSHVVAAWRKEDLPGGLVRDHFGCVLRQGDFVTHLEEPALTKPSLDGYRWPDVEALADWDALAEQYAAWDDRYRLCGMCYGFFERASFMRGVEPLLMDMIEHPQFVHDLLDGYLELRLQAIDRIIDRIPVEGIFGGGDDCDQRGPMMGLERWREFIGCRLARVVEHVHAKGLPVVAHMCGNVRPLVDDLLAMRLDVLESLQPEAMDVYELKQKTAGRMALVGGLGTQSVLPRGTPDEVRAETRRLLREMGKGGGYILAPAKPLMEDVPTENAVAFIETALDQ